MLVILDGENKCGKSSLAKELQKITGWEIIHFSQPKKEAYIEYVEFLLNRKKPAILDRFYLGEKVYGPLWRGKSELEEWQTRMIEMLLMARYSFNVYCETNVETIVENFKKEKEQDAKVEQIPDVLQHFRKAVTLSELNWWEFDYQKDKDYKLIKENFIQWLGIYKQNEKYIESLIETRAIGNPFARNVIVGEICNGKRELEKYRDIILPFAKGVSSTYLWKAIKDIPKSRYLLTNVHKYHDKGRIRLNEILEGKAENVICLGLMAFKIIDYFNEQQLPFKKISLTKHPAWANRFNMDVEEYSRSIKDKLI